MEGTDPKAEEVLRNRRLITGHGTMHFMYGFHVNYILNLFSVLDCHMEGMNPKAEEVLSNRRLLIRHGMTLIMNSFNFVSSAKCKTVHKHCNLLYYILDVIKV